MRRVVVVLIGIAILVSAVGLYSFFSLSEERQVNERPVRLKQVDVAVVSYHSPKAEVIAPGRVTSSNIIDLRAVGSGYLCAGDKPLKKGQHFHKGALLFHVETDNILNQLKANKSRLLSLLATILADLKIDYPDRFPVWKDFFEAISLDKNLPPLPELTNTQEKIYISGKGLLNQYYTIKDQEVAYRRHFVYAPFQGSVVQVLVEPGSYVAMGTSVTRIISTVAKEIEIPLPIEDAHFVKVGNRVEILDNQENPLTEGKVVRKAGFIDPQTQSVSVFALLKNVRSSAAARKIYQGMYLKGKFTGIPMKEVMEIPREAVFNSNEVFVVRGGILKTETVEVVRHLQRTAYIRGLSIGDTVVVQQLYGISEGQPVRPRLQHTHSVSTHNVGV